MVDLKQCLMSRASCKNCQRPITVCFCHTLKRVENDWPVHILQHNKEAKHAIGTAIIAQLSLQSCQILTAGNNPCEQTLEQLINDQQPLLIYPGNDSLPLRKIVGQTPRPLIFIDSTWRKSKRMLLESPQLQSLPKVSFTPTQPGRYQIRKAPNVNALSTLEAIVTVLATLENAAEKYQPLLTTMDWMVQQQIEKMGVETFARNYP